MIGFYSSAAQIPMVSELRNWPDVIMVERVLLHASSGDIGKAVQIADDYTSQQNVLAFIASVMLKSTDILPGAGAAILSSSVTKHPTLSGCLQRFNKPEQFIACTYDRDPWIIIDLGESISAGYPLYLYNRCQLKEISERLIGCRFWASNDKTDWERIDVPLGDDEIYNHRGIEICCPRKIRYIRIDRTNSNTPIHLSQITLGRPLESQKNITRVCNLLFAKKYDMAIDDEGLIVEQRLDVKSARITFSCHGRENQISLCIPFVGRFSNFLIQITNAIAIAERLGIDEVHIPDNGRVRDVFPTSDAFACKSYPVTIRIGDSPPGVCMEAFCFYATNLLPDSNELPSMYSLVNEFKQYCYLEPVRNDENLRILTIHIRSGDVFADGKVHSGYGQPPLSFYREAISHYKPDVVTLVYQNELNPVIPALIQYLRSASIEHRLQSSKLLREDIAVLVGARALVIGAGTFAKGVLAFNSCLDTIYTFDKKLPFRWIPESQAATIKNFVIADGQGMYRQAILSNNWTNSPEQRSLMLSYPSENLLLFSPCQASQCS